MEFGQKEICEIDLFDFTSFLAWTFLNILAQGVISDIYSFYHDHILKESLYVTIF